MDMQLYALAAWVSGEGDDPPATGNAGKPVPEPRQASQRAIGFSTMPHGRPESIRAMMRPDAIP